MQKTQGAWGLVIVATLLVSGCNKKADGGPAGTGSATTTTAAATGIKGTLNGKPFEAKSALLGIDNEEHTGTLHLKPFANSTCGVGDLLKEEEVSVTTPGPKKGVTAFDGDKAYGELMWHKEKGSTTTTTVSTGEIEWITIPTATTKGLARVKLLKEPEHKIEGSMEVTLCAK